MLTPRRLLLGLALLLVLTVAWSVWTAWLTQKDLTAAEQAVDRLQSAVENGDDEARDAALDDLQDSAGSARGRTDGFWWSAMTRVPVVGDDAAGVEALSASVDLIAQDAVGPLVATVDSLEGLVSGGRVDPTKVAALQEPIDQASRAMQGAVELVAARDSEGFVPTLRTRYDDYTRRIADLADDFGAAETAVDVLPAILGSDGPRDYFFVFQNNAEVRSTGGLPGSWARVHVEDGRFDLVQQGGAGDFFTGEVETELTPEELAVYDRLPGLYFQDANFIPDFPRVAEIYNDFWAVKYPDVELDGVMALDPVGMSYLLQGTGPVTVGALTLKPESIVGELLSNTYLTVADPVQQDRRFQRVARALFAAATGEIASPVDFAMGASRAIEEGRFLFAPFQDDEADRLEGSTILGTLSGDDGDTPHVDIGVNDATGSKMSYYLRYNVDVQAQACRGGVQQLAGSMTLNQTIDPMEAETLPGFVTGGGLYGIPAGSQLVALRVYGPSGGTIENVRVDGKRLDVREGLVIDGRPVVTVAPLIETPDDVVVTWEMNTGQGQTGAGQLGVTPSVVPGNADSSFASAC